MGFVALCLQMQKLKCFFRKFTTILTRRFRFFCRNSSIHGLKYICQEDGNMYFTRFFWFLILAASSGCLYLLLWTVLRARTEVSFTSDTLYLKWNTKFPAVTIREIYVAKTAQRKLAELYPDLIRPLNYDYRRHLADVLFGVGSSSRSTFQPCGATVSCDIAWREIVNNVYKKCDELITECRFNSVPFICCEKFFIVDSEYGPCYSFNSLQHKNFDQEALFTVNQSTGPGELTFRLLSDAQVSFHSSEELSTKFHDTKFKVDVNVNNDELVNILFDAVEVENDPLLQFENSDIRGCRYLHEIPQGLLHTYPVYSYGACRLAGNTEGSFVHCGCVHPVRDLSYKELYCNYTGLNCLVTYEAQKAKLGINKDIHRDNCLPSCVESELTIVHTSKRSMQKQSNKGSLISVRMASLPTLRYHKNLHRTNLDLVVTVGGMLGLFFSASILSLAETFYLITRIPNKK